MATNFEIRLLLALWDLSEIAGGQGVNKSKLNERFNKKSQEISDACGSLEQSGAIAATVKGKGKGEVRLFGLTNDGKMLLAKELAGDEFKFNEQIGAKTANAVLKWLRSQSNAETLVAEPVSVATIASYEAFKTVALETFDRLNRDFKLDNLVPIYRIRREIGEQVSRSDFDLWLLEMQANDVLQLIGGEMPELTPDIFQDSVKTALDAIRYYAQRI